MTWKNKQQYLMAELPAYDQSLPLQIPAKRFIRTGKSPPKRPPHMRWGSVFNASKCRQTCGLRANNPYLCKKNRN